jgi:predicted ABC-type ATPase
MPPRELIIIGGPNGAGKSTFATEELACRGGFYLSADLIAAELNPLNSSQAAIKAGRQFLIRVPSLLRTEHRLVIEATLAGRSLTKILTAAKHLQFQVSVKFLYVDSAVVSLERVSQRVRNGGHDVPEIDVRRRFGRSIHNFWNHYRCFASDWVVLYNQTRKPEPVVSGVGNEQFVHSEELFTRFLHLVQVHSHD